MGKLLEVLDKIVRPYVTMLFATAAVWGWLFAGKLSDDAFLGLSGIVIGFWFQARSSASPPQNGTPVVGKP